MIEKFQNYMGKDSPEFFIGVVEDNSDPMTLGRVKVRVFGIHPDDKTLVPTKDLPWATVLTMDESRSPNLYNQGTWVFGMFLDSKMAQYPLIFGMIPGVTRSGAPGEQGATNSGYMSSGEQGTYVDKAPYHGHNIDKSNNPTNLNNSSISGGNNIKDSGIYVHSGNKNSYPLKYYNYSSSSGGRGLASRDGGLNIHYPSVMALEELSKQAKGSAFGINSAYRSPSHNARVGGARQSLHVEGRAFDISKSSIPDVNKFLELAARNGFVGFGNYNTFIHIDTGTGRVWAGKGTSGFSSDQMAALRRGGWVVNKKGLQGVKFDAAAAKPAANTPAPKNTDGSPAGDGTTNTNNNTATKAENKNPNTKEAVQDRMREYYTSKGYTEAQQAGILAHAQSESQFNPQANNPNDKGKQSYGLFQYRGSRLDGLKSFSESNGMDYRTVDAQLEFQNHEFQTTHKREFQNLKNSTTPAEASVAMNGYERFQGYKNAYGGESLKRINQANAIAGGSVSKGDLPGFYDPTNSYPEPSTRGQPTTHHAARGMNATPFNNSRAGARNNNYSGFPAAGDKGTFGSPPNPVAPQYPHNKVYSTNSGHIMEFDDTPGAERTQISHKSGSTWQITANGSQRQDTTGNYYNFVSKDSFFGTHGSIYMTSVDDMNIRTTSDLKIQSDGSTTEMVFGEKSTTISGNFNILVGGYHQVKVKKIYIEAGEINLYSKGDTHFTSEGDTHINATGAINLTAGKGVNITGHRDVRIASGVGNVHLKGVDVYIDDVVKMAMGLAQQGEQAVLAASTDLGKAPPKKSVKKVTTPDSHPDAYVTAEEAASVYGKQV